MKKHNTLNVMTGGHVRLSLNRLKPDIVKLCRKYRALFTAVIRFLPYSVATLKIVMMFCEVIPEIFTHVQAVHNIGTDKL